MKKTLIGVEPISNRVAAGCPQALRLIKTGARTISARRLPFPCGSGGNLNNINFIPGGQLIVARGVNGTTAAAHSLNAPVFLVSDQRGAIPPNSSPAFVNMGAIQGGTAASPVFSFAVEPNGTTTVGNSLGSVTVLYQNGGVPISGAVVSITISSSTLNGTTTATTDSLGEAVFSNLSVPTIGIYTLTATTGLIEVASTSFVNVGPSSILVTTNSDAPTHMGTSLRDAVTAANIDAAGGQSETITFASSLSGQTITLTQGIGLWGRRHHHD